jgi:pyruvate/2-oxoglutarate/acetoin dehydrogenase E1 component
MKELTKRSFAQEIHSAIEAAIKRDSNVVVGGQLVRYGVAGLTTGLYDKYPENFITFPVSESLMNSSSMGLALAGKRVITIHVRIDFLASGMCALVNHIPIWFQKGHDLPIVFICQVGKGMGQGAQHSKDLSYWFKSFQGWNVVTPETPKEAYDLLLTSIFGNQPTLYVIHRELFDAKEPIKLMPLSEVRLCGASRRHERFFYGKDHDRHFYGDLNEYAIEDLSGRLPK